MSEHALAEAGKRDLTVGGGVEGVDGVGDEALRLGRIQLFQEKNKIMKGLQARGIQAVPGMLHNTADEDVPLKALTFVPAYLTKFWDLFEEQTIPNVKQKWLGRYFKADAPELEGKTTRPQKVAGGSLKAEVQEVLSLVAVNEDDGLPVGINFKGTSYNAGQDLYTMARKAGGALWTRAYELSSVLRGKDGNEYYILKVVGAGEADPEIATKAESIYRSISKNRGAVLSDDEAGSAQE